MDNMHCPNVKHNCYLISIQSDDMHRMTRGKEAFAGIYCWRNKSHLDADIACNLV